MTNQDKGKLVVDYKSNAGRHRHKLCNHCSDCGKPLLASFCGEHQPSWLVYWAGRLEGLLFNIKARLKKWEEL